MDSTNFQHHENQQQQQQQHHLQEHFVGCSPLNNHPSGYPVSTSLEWKPTILSTSRNSGNTYNHKLYHEDDFHACTGDSRSETALSSTSIIPITDNEARNFTCQASNLSKNIEEDMLNSFPSFGGLIPHTTTNTSMAIPGWFNALPSGAPYGRGLFHLPMEQKDHQSSYSNNDIMNNWSGHGFPSTSLLNQMGLVSSPNSTTTSVSSSPRLGLNLQAMDFMGNTNSSFGSLTRPLYDGVGEEVISPPEKIISNKPSTLSGVTGTKRAAHTSDQPKASTSNSTTKKSQLKVSCPPFKVRKEKLGERVAALHQLVSPFGKTDTASVLTEAIGYIQFLQDQIHTLCMPHAKTSRNKPCRPFPMGTGTEDDEKEEARIDLRRRGLCLVPLQWTSYMTTSQLDTSNISYY